MALQVLRVKIGLVAVRARELSVGILGRNRGILRGTIDTVGNGSRTPRNTREDPAAALRPDHLRARRLLPIWRGSIGLRDGIPVHPRRALAIRVAEGARRHTRVLTPTIPRRSRGDRLRVRLRTGRGRQHAVRGGIVLRLRLSLRVGMREEGRRRQAAHSGVRHDGSGRRRVNIMGGRGEPRQIRPVRRLAHVRVRARRLCVMRLQRGESVRLRHRVLGLHGVLRHRHAGDRRGGQRRGALG
jgi:hypothetical protein